MHDRLSDPDGREQPVAGVAEGNTGPVASAVVVEPAVEPVGAGEGGARLVVAGDAAAVGAFLESARVAVDEVGLDLAQALVVEPLLLHGAFAHVVLNDVSGGDQLASQLLALRS